MYRGTTRVGVVALAWVLSGCGSDETSISAFTAKPLRSVEVAVQQRAGEVAAVFLERMSDPEVTYRVSGQAKMGEPGDNGLPAAQINTAYDVFGDDYGGSVHLSGHALDDSVVGDYQAVVLDGTTHIWSSSRLTWSSADTPETARRPNPFADLDGDDLILIGQTDDGLFEYEATPWIGGDPIGEWSDVGVFEGGALPPIEVRSHQTRLTVDADGIPHRLTSSWTFVAGPGGESAVGSFVDKYSAIGLYVVIPEPVPNGPPIVTSHDVIVGVRADHTAIVEPWFEVEPPKGMTAEVSLTFNRPADPIMLGIEGVIGFARSRAANGDLVLDRVISLQTDTVEVPVGDQTFVVYYRPCDGFCSTLDPPTVFCSILHAFDADGRYELTVDVVSEDRAVCTLGPAATD